MDALLRRYYRPAKAENWRGRVDSKIKERVHQWMQLLPLDKLATAQAGGVVLVGFACDEGVRRNHGRLGAAGGPQALREALANLSLDEKSGSYLYDGGDIVCDDSDLEAAQAALGALVAQLRQVGLKPLVLGGGHETAWGHFQGLAPSVGKDKRLAVVNFDAHFDLRPLLPGGRGSSGTPFLQIAELCQREQRIFDYSCFGIQPAANTKSLFSTAAHWQVDYLLAEEIEKAASPELGKKVGALTSRADHLYVSLCLDVFAASSAPGVSAIQALGLSPWHIVEAFRSLFRSGRVIALDVVELAPALDQQNMTARLGAHFIWQALQEWH